MPLPGPGARGGPLPANASPLTTLLTDDGQKVALETLLRPVPGPDPSGRTLQYERTYDLIKEARRADDPSAPRDIWAKDLKAADWKEVRRLCEDALVRESKDLQVCAWLAEAWLHLEGIRGLRRGIELLLQVSEAYWETVHPDLSAGVDFRVAPFVWVNEKLTASLGQVVILEAGDDDTAPPARWDDWKRALWLDKVRARRPQDAEIQAQVKAGLTLDAFKRRCTHTPEAFFRENLAAIEGCIEVTRALEAFLDDRLGPQSPSLVRFREALAEIHAWTSVVVREGNFKPEPQGGAAMSAQKGPETLPGPAGGAGGGRNLVAGPITSRADAYKMLHAAAQYLKEVEPHSPTPYLVLKAVSWGGKSLDDLLREFVREGLDLKALFTFLGIEPGEKR